MKLLNKFERWFDLHLGWLFVNGRKQDQWHQYLKEKYEIND